MFLVDQRGFLCCCPPRMALVDTGFFGDVGASVQKRLDAAYQRFKGFCKSRKIQSSQPPFTEKMAA